MLWGTWTIGETGQHVSGSAEYFLAAAHGEADLERLVPRPVQVVPSRA